MQNVEEEYDPLDDSIEIADNMEDMVEHTKREAENPFVEEEKQEEPKPVEENYNYNNLTSKKLKELCKSKGYRNYSKLTKPNLIKMLNGEEVVIPERPKRNKTVTTDTKVEEVKPKKEKLIEKPKPKPKELKDNLHKEEPLIKNEEVIKPKRKPKPKPQPAPKPLQPRPQLPPQNQLLRQELPPQKPLYNPFKNYYTIM